MLAGGGPPLGYTLSGALAAAIGPAAALVAGAATCAVFVGGIGLWRRELRDPYLGSLSRPREQAENAAARLPEPAAARD
jgi:hypothetical protein